MGHGGGSVLSRAESGARGQRCESVDTVRDAAEEIAHKKFTGGFGPNFLLYIRNQVGGPQGRDFYRRAAGARKFRAARPDERRSDARRIARSRLILISSGGEN